MIVPKLGSKSRHKQLKRSLDNIDAPTQIPQNTDLKICSTLECPRCHAEQTEYRATCRRCMACFYCGLVGGSKYQCQICGNHIPKEDRTPYEPKSIKIA